MGLTLQFVGSIVYKITYRGCLAVFFPLNVCQITEMSLTAWQLKGLQASEIPCSPCCEIEEVADAYKLEFPAASILVRLSSRSIANERFKAQNKVQNRKKYIVRNVERLESATKIGRAHV